MKSLFTLILLFSTSIVFAEVEIPKPPKILKAKEIENNDVADTLVNKINALIKRKENSYTDAKVVLANDTKIIINYEYRYTEIAVNTFVKQTLIYQKIKNNWQLTQVLYGYIESISHIEDLTGDGIPEIILSNFTNIRSYYESEYKVMIYDTQYKKYIESNLKFRGEGSADCNGKEYIDYDISIKKQTPLLSFEKKPLLPYIIVYKKSSKIKQKTCNREESRLLLKYVWSKKKNKFISLETNLIEIFLPDLWDWFTNW